MEEESQALSDEEAVKRAYLAKLQLRAALKTALTKEAFERLERVKMANPELYAKAVQAVLYMFRQRGSKIDDNTLLVILKKLRGERRSTNIKIIRK